MRLLINSKLSEVGEIRKIRQLLEYLQFKPDSIALVVNSEHVLRCDWDKFELEENMQVDIISPMVGG